MAFARKIDWSSAMRDMRRDRTSVLGSSFAQKSIEAARLQRLRNEAHARPFVISGSYDCSAIMGAAVAQARLLRAKGSKDGWSKLIGTALKAIWSNAKATRMAGAH